MTRLPGLYQWNDVVAKHFPHLSKPMAACLALWSLGMIVARSCSLTAIAWALNPLLGQRFYTLRERLRDLYREAPAKKGDHRRQLDLKTCWAPWLAWVVEDWHSQQLALALDATTLGQRFTVLAISVLYRGCAVPVVWKILKADEKHRWKPEWQALLRRFRKVIPNDWTVIVLTDRGLYAKWLFRAICRRGWHPLMRINSQGKFRPNSWRRWIPLKDAVTHVGQRWEIRGTAFQSPGASLRCTLLAWWGEGHEEPWLVVTDLPPQAANVCWYGLRAWIEQGFKRIKRGGWQWQNTRMEDPARAERLWLAVAVATWWLLSVGGESDAEVRVETLGEVPNAQTGQRPRWRLIAIFRRGYNEILACLLHGHQLPLGEGIPEPWQEIVKPWWEEILAAEKQTATDQLPPGNLQL
jgi:hypothetical protein